MNIVQVLTLRHGKIPVGLTKELQITQQLEDKFLAGAIPQTYQSYSEGIGQWICGKPDLDRGNALQISPLSIQNPAANGCSQTHPLLNTEQMFQINLSSSQTLSTNVQNAFTACHFNISM